MANHARSRYVVFALFLVLFVFNPTFNHRLWHFRDFIASFGDAPVSTLYSHLDIPVTCKIRKVGTEANTLALARMLQDHGAQVLTVHGRTRHQKQQFTGAVDWEIIRKIKFVRNASVFRFSTSVSLVHIVLSLSRRASSRDVCPSARPGTRCASQSLRMVEWKTRPTLRMHLKPRMLMLSCLQVSLRANSC